MPLPEWFRKGSNCRLKSKSMLNNFPSYLRSIAEQEPNKLQDELQYIKYEKARKWTKILFSTFAILAAVEIYFFVC